jgi:hypothetical protein
MMCKNKNKIAEGNSMVDKLVLSLMVLMLTVSISLAAGPQGIHEPGTGLTDPEMKDAAQGTGQGLMAANETNISAATPGIHEPGTGITNPEVKEAAQEAAQGAQAQAGQPSQETETTAQETQPGFELIFALAGLMAVAHIALRRRG